MVHRHLSRLNAPKSWPIRRKGIKFITRPSPGAHNFATSIPLSLVLTNILKHARVNKEVKKILYEGKVLVNNQVRKDHHMPVGLMDVITVPSLNEAHRVVFTEKGKFKLLKLKDNEKDLHLQKVVNKTIISKGKVQINLLDGGCIVLDKDDYKTGDTIVSSFKDKKVIEHIPFKKGAKVYMYGGKSIGKVGKLEAVKENQIIVKTKEGSFETAKRYAFVVGERQVIEE